MAPALHAGNKTLITRLKNTRYVKRLLPYPAFEPLKFIVFEISLKSLFTTAGFMYSVGVPLISLFVNCIDAEQSAAGCECGKTSGPVWKL